MGKVYTLEIERVKSMSKVWFITGCSKGLGRVLSEELLAKTDSVVVATARDVSTLNILKKEYGDRVLPLTLDVKNSDHIKAAVDEACQKFSRIDVLVNNAGYGLGGAVEECSMQSIRNVFDVNVFGLMEMTKAVLPIMRSQNCGHIFNISSVAGLVASAGVGIYNSTKYAVEGLSEALCMEVKTFGINVTIIQPGPFRTDFLGDSLEVAPALSAYADTAAAQARNYRHQSHNKQNGDPLKAAQIIIQLAAQENPPLRMPLGNVAMDKIHLKMEALKEELTKFEETSRSADYC